MSVLLAIELDVPVDRPAELDPTTTYARDERLVDDADAVTSAGVSAGIEMALHLVARPASYVPGRSGAAVGTTPPHRSEWLEHRGGLRLVG